MRIFERLSCWYALRQSDDFATRARLPHYRGGCAYGRVIPEHNVLTAPVGLSCGEEQTWCSYRVPWSSRGLNEEQERKNKWDRAIELSGYNVLWPRSAVEVWSVDRARQKQSGEDQRALARARLLTALGVRVVARDTPHYHHYQGCATLCSLSLSLTLPFASLEQLYSRHWLYRCLNTAALR